MAPLLSEEEMALDPYTILGLTSDADEKAIKKSYRMLSLKYHPDKNSAPEAGRCSFPPLLSPFSTSRIRERTKQG